MLVTDLLHSCANDRVAEAAVASIGGDFAMLVRMEAEDGDVSVGRFTASVVRAFAIGASERDWRDLAFAVRGHDHPVLAGLQLILTRRLARSARSAGEPTFPVPAAIALAASPA